MFHFSYLDWFEIVQISLLIRRKGKKEKMNKLFSKIAALSVGLAMAVGVGVALGHEGVREVKAADAEFTLSSAAAVTVDGVTASFAKGSGSTAPTWYAAGLRLYASNTVTISSESTITGVTFNWEKQGSKAFSTVTASAGNYTHPSATGQGTWEGSANEIVFTLGSAGQLQLNTFAVTYGGETPTGPFTVTYNGNGATSGSMTDSTEYESGATVTIMACGYMRTDYEVTGWNTKADGSGTAYGLSAQFTITSNVTLYAQWHSLVPEPGSEEDPYTVAEARAAIDAGTGVTGVYATGIISEIPYPYTSKNGVTFNITVDGKVGDVFLQAYKARGSSSYPIDSADDVVVGATVVVKGNLTKYGSTYEFAAGCTVESYSAPVLPTIETIPEIYTATDGSPVAVDGYFVGQVSDGLYIMNGEYGIFVYRGSAPDGAVVNETKLHVEGISATFNNLRQIGTGATISVSTAEVATPINYSITGSESSEDLSIESRRLLEKGVITKISRDGTDYLPSYEGEVPTVDTSKDIFLTLGESLQVIYKKSDVTQTGFETLFAYLLNGKKVYLEAFTSFFKTEFQLRYSSVVEATEGYTAEDFAADLISKTDEVCAGYDGVTDNKEALAAKWLELQSKVLSDEEVARFNDEENDFAAARARYDYLVGKYGLTDFLVRNPAPIGGSNYNFAQASNNSYIIIIVISAVSVMSFGLALFLRKKRSK